MAKMILQYIKNGIYEGRALCRPDEDEDFTAYNLTLKVTVRDDKIGAVTDVKGDGDSSNDRYILRAANGTSNKKRCDKPADRER